MSEAIPCTTSRTPADHVCSPEPLSEISNLNRHHIGTDTVAIVWRSGNDVSASINYPFIISFHLRHIDDERKPFEYYVVYRVMAASRKKKFVGVGVGTDTKNVRKVLYGNC